MFQLASFRKRNLPCGRASRYPSVTAMDALAADACFLKQRCRKLHVIVICMAPWEAIPGAAPNPARKGVNQPPAASQVPISGGLPINMRLTAKPATVPRPLAGANYTEGTYTWSDTYAVPQALYERYGQSLARASLFTFDFAKRGVRSGEATGQLAALGGKHATLQASLDFVYRWCGPKACAGEILPVFEITNCTSINARFVVLGDVDEFLPTEDDECADAFVVLGLQQWCCEAFADQVIDDGAVLEPTGCDAVPLSCTARRVLGSCDRA